MRREHIHVRCETCGNAARVTRAGYDPDEAAEMATSQCNLCDTGDFESVHYTDSSGDEVMQ